MELTKARRLFNMRVHNVAAVGKAANRRTFLVVKGRTLSKKIIERDGQYCVVSADGEKTLGCHNTYDDAQKQLTAVEANKMEKSTFSEVLTRRETDVYNVLSKHFGALMETVDSIFFQPNDYPNPAENIGEAIDAFVTSIQKSKPKVLKNIRENLTKGADVTSAGMDEVVKLRDRLTAYLTNTEERNMSDTNTQQAGAQQETNATPPDVGTLSKMGRALASVFGQHLGATDDTLKAFEEEETANATAKAAAELSARLEALEKSSKDEAERREKAEAEVKRLTEENKLRKFASKAQELSHVGFDPSRDAGLLKTLSESLSEEESARLNEIFASLKSQISKSEILREYGSSGESSPEGGSAVETVENRAAELMSKSDKLSREDARSKVFREDASLYERYRRETTVKI